MPEEADRLRDMPLENQAEVLVLAKSPDLLAQRALERRLADLGYERIEVVGHEAVVLFESGSKTLSEFVCLLSQRRSAVRELEDAPDCTRIDVTGVIDLPNQRVAQGESGPPQSIAHGSHPIVRHLGISRLPTDRDYRHEFERSAEPPRAFAFKADSHPLLEHPRQDFERGVRLLLGPG
jgi:hypothetical protein